VDKYRVKNWSNFQHYKDRKPAWIKLHRDILDDYSFQTMPDASRALAPCIWLLASEYEEGAIPADHQMLAFRFRRTEKEIREAIKPLIDRGFLYLEQNASKPLAERKQSAMPEEEEEREKEEEVCGEQSSPQTVITFPLNDKSEHAITQDQVTQWAELYPAVDVVQELRKMKGWLVANPKKRKTKSGVGKFVNGWLSSEQDKGGRKGVPEPTSRPEHRAFPA